MTEDDEADTDAQADEAADEVEESETEETAETEGAEETEESEEGLGEGDFVEIAYTARTVEDGQLVDTTDIEVAEEEGVADQDHEFKPRTIILGEGHIFEDVEEAIVGAEPGDTGTVTIAAEDAFGAYDPDDVETISAEKIDEDDRYPGAHVQIDGQHGNITTVIGGRARVDFNHPLAGEDVEYEYEVLSEVEDRAQQAAGLFEMYVDVSPEVHIEVDEVEEEVEVESEGDEEGEGEESEPKTETQTVEKETLYVESTPQLTMNQQWMFSKQQIAQDVMENVGVDRVIVQDVIDGSGGMGMGGMMGGMGGMEGMGGEEDIEEALEDADVDADEIVEELEGEGDVELDTEE